MSKPLFHKLPPRAIRIWQWSNSIGNLFLFGLPALYYLFFQDSVNQVFLISLIVIISIIYLLYLLWIPFLQWKKWRYSVDENEIHLKRGVIIKRETLIPLNRVQHVDTRQGPLLQWYNLSTVSISTAATTHEIPNLDSEIALRVRSTISTNARLAKEDV